MKEFWMSKLVNTLQSLSQPTITWSSFECCGIYYLEVSQPCPSTAFDRMWYMSSDPFFPTTTRLAQINGDKVIVYNEKLGTKLEQILKGILPTACVELHNPTSPNHKKLINTIIGKCKLKL